MSADTKSVDVLAVLAFHARAQECTDYPRLRSFDELECARAAVAELIAAGQMVERDLAWTRTEHTTALNALSDALARVQGDAA